MQVREVAAVIAVLLVGVPTVWALSGLGDTQDPTIDGPVFASSDDSATDGMTAQVTGRLRLSEGCLLLGDIPVIWPHGTRWDEEEQAVQLADGILLPMGTEVIGGGGYPRVGNMAGLYSDAFAAEIRRCPTDESAQVAVFNPSEDVERVP